MKSFLVICGVVLLVAACCGWPAVVCLGVPPAEKEAQRPADVDLEGIYRFTGKGGDEGKDYHGAGYIWKFGDGYRVQWAYRGALPAVGRGTMVGKKFVVGFDNSPSGNNPGVAIFDLETVDGKLRMAGKWAMYSERQMVDETWTWLAELE